MFEELQILIRANQISAVILVGQILEDNQLAQLAEALKNNQSVTMVKLIDNEVSIEGMRTFIEILKEKSSPITVDLKSYQACASLKELQDVFVRNNEFKQLLAQILANQISSIIFDNRMDTVEVKQIADALKDNRSVTDLYYQSQTNAIGGQIWCDVLSRNRSITTLTLCGFNNNDDIQVLSDSLKVNLTLTTLNLSSNQIGDIGLQALSEALNENQILTAIRLGSNQIGDVGVQALSEMLKKNQTLTTLDLSSNQIGDIGAQALSEALRINRSPITISLYHNQIGDEGIQALSEALSANPINTVEGVKFVGEKDLNTAHRNQRFKQLLLQIYANQISELALSSDFENSRLEKFLEALKHNCSVNTLSIYRYDSLFTVAGIQALNDLLKINKTLTHIKLWDAEISDRGAQALSEVLKINRTVTRFDLRVTGISTVGIQALSEALKKNQTLTAAAIELESNQISDMSVRALSEVLKVNRCLSSFHLQVREMGDVVAKILGEMLKENQTLTTVLLDSNQISVMGMQALCEALKVNLTVTNLHLKNTGIGDMDVQVLGEALKENQTLTTLDVSHNQIGDVGMQALSEMLKVNQTLTNINVEDNPIGDVGTRALCDALRINQMPITLKLNRGNRHIQDIHYIYEQKEFEQWLMRIRSNQILEIDLCPYSYNSIKQLKKLQIKQWLETLKQNQSVTNLTLTACQPDTIDMQILNEVLKENQTLTMLKFDNIKIDDTSVQTLSAALTTNHTLKTLHFKSKYDHPVLISDSGAQALSAMLQVNQTLTQLNLYTHQIGDSGVQALCKALMLNQSVTTLNLGCNISEAYEEEQQGRISDNGAQALSEMLKVNQTLTAISLKWNQIGEVGTQALSEALKINRTLMTLNLSFNEIGNEGLKALSEALKINRSLTKLKLARTEIGDEGAKALAEAMLVNSSLINIDLQSNGIGTDGGFALMVSIAKNHSITSFRTGYYSYGHDHGDERLCSDYAKAIDDILEDRRKQIKNIRNQTLLTILILLRYAYTLEGYRWPGSQKNLGTLSPYHLPAEIWRLISHWLDFPSVERGYRTSCAVAEFLTQKKIFTEFNQRLQTGESFCLVESHGSKIGESRFSFLAPFKLRPASQVAFIENGELLVPEKSKIEKTSGAEDIKKEKITFANQKVISAEKCTEITNGQAINDQSTNIPTFFAADEISYAKANFFTVKSLNDIEKKIAETSKKRKYGAIEKSDEELTDAEKSPKTKKLKIKVTEASIEIFNNDGDQSSTSNPSLIKPK